MNLEYHSGAKVLLNNDELGDIFVQYPDGVPSITVITYYDSYYIDKRGQALSGFRDDRYNVKKLLSKEENPEYFL